MRNVIQIVIVVLILLTCGGIFTVCVVNTREAAARMECTNNLKQLGLAVHNYAQRHDGSFPVAAMPNPDLPPEKRLSWLVVIWPYVEAGTPYHKMDHKKSWDAEENRFATEMRFGCLHCPGYSGEPPDSRLRPTNYVGISGIGDNAIALPREDQRAGIFGYDQSVKLEEMKRGTSEILFVVETSQVSGAWTAAGPPTSRGLIPDGSAYIGAGGQFGGNHRGGANVTFADGSVRFVEQSIDPRVWEAMATLSGKGNQE